MKNRLSRFRIIDDGKKFKRVFDLDDPKPKGLPNGMIKNEELEEIEPGSSFTLGGKKFFVLSCTLKDYIMEYLHRKTQIIYPKEAGYILLNLDIFPGRKVGEAGTGSGALTAIFSRAVGERGEVFSFEKRDDFTEIIQKNLEVCREYENIKFFNRPLQEVDIPKDFDAFFLDMKFPWEVLPKVNSSLKPGGRLGLLLPTTNQVTRIISTLQASGYFIHEVSEIFRRSYKLNAERFRPEDVMTGHTGYLVFASKLKKTEEGS